MLAALVGGVMLLAASAAFAGSSSSGSKTSVIYNTVPGNAPPNNIPSMGPEAYAFNEFGNEVTFAGTNRKLSNVVVTMSSWGCVSGTWFNDDCSTPAGATFSVPITLTVYNVVGSGTSSTLGTALASTTQTFSIPYRPSASATCAAQGHSGEWYQSSGRKCFNGYATNVTFNFGQSVTLPSTAVIGISYNTSHFGPNPIGTSTACYTSSGGCPYDSLNIGLTTSTPTVGSDPVPTTFWQDSTYAGAYCDGGAAGLGTFRLDSPTCSEGYVPAIQVKAGG